MSIPGIACTLHQFQTYCEPTGYSLEYPSYLVKLLTVN
jgi:hypothetical protein